MQKGETHGRSGRLVYNGQCVLFEVQLGYWLAAQLCVGYVAGRYACLLFDL